MTNREKFKEVFGFTPERSTHLISWDAKYKPPIANPFRIGDEVIDNNGFKGIVISTQRFSSRVEVRVLYPFGSFVKTYHKESDDFDIKKTGYHHSSMKRLLKEYGIDDSKGELDGD